MRVAPRDDSQSEAVRVERFEFFQTARGNIGSVVEPGHAMLGACAIDLEGGDFAIAGEPVARNAHEVSHLCQF